MRKLILATAAALLFAGPAWALVVTGTVAEFDREAGKLVLQDGQSFDIPPEAQIPPEVAVGTQVTVTTKNDDSTRVESVTVAM